jgi:integrase
MRTRRPKDQGFRIETREWESKGKDGKEEMKQSFRLFWLTDNTLASGRRKECSQQGFRTEGEARNFYFKRVVPALHAGFNTPKEQAAHERRLKESADANEPTLHEMVERHLDDARTHLKPKSLQNRSYNLRAAVRHLNGIDQKISRISDDEVRKWVNSPARGKKPTSDTKIGRCRALAMVFQEAVEKGHITVNPCKMIKLPKPSEGRMNPLPLEDIVKLLRACKKLNPRNDAETSASYVHAFVAFSFYTGARADEVMHAEWTDIDWGSCHVTIQPKEPFNWTTKNDKARVVQANPMLLRILREYDIERRERLRDAELRLKELIAWHAASPEERTTLSKPEVLQRYERAPSTKSLIAKADGLAASLRRQIESPLIFPNPAGFPMTEVPKGYWTALKDSGLKKKGYVFHSLRETFGTLLAKKGVDLLSLKTLMGHKDIETTMCYIAYSPDYAASHGTKMPDVPVLTEDDDDDRSNGNGVCENPDAKCDSEDLSSEESA